MGVKGVKGGELVVYEGPRFFLPPFFGGFFLPLDRIFSASQKKRMKKRMKMKKR
jgi:hypothetical protein